MATKIACVHCGFIFEDEDMEVCPVCGTELGKEWNPAELQSFVVTELSTSQAEVIGKLLHKKGAEISAMLASDGCIGLDDLTPIQVESYTTTLNASGIKFIVETPEQKAVRVQEQLKARAAKDAAHAADASAAAETAAKARAEAEAKAKQAAAIEAENAAAKAAADSAAKQAQAAADAEKARLSAEENKAKLAAETAAKKAEAEAKVAADAARQLELEKSKAEAEAQVKIAEAQAIAAASAEKTKQMELEASEAKKKRRSKILKWGCGSVVLIVILFVGLLVYAGYESEKTARVQAQIEAEERARKEEREAEERALAKKREVEERAQEKVRKAAAKKAEAEREAREQAREVARSAEKLLRQKCNWNFSDGTKLELVYCPAGSFTMGSPSNEAGRSDNETQHRVTLTKSFLIGKYEVTQAQYKAVMGKNPSKSKNENAPVENVSWDDAMEFCDELNARTTDKRPQGYHFTLPTEAQWEYACRAGTNTAFNNGRSIRQPEGNDKALGQVGWFEGNSFESPHNVGQKRSNAWGIFDMHGNVSEWCKDAPDRDEDGIKDYNRDATDPCASFRTVYRIMRGGGTCTYAKGCRSAKRGNYNHDAPYPNGGFRIVLAPVQ